MRTKLLFLSMAAIGIMLPSCNDDIATSYDNISNEHVENDRQFEILTFNSCDELRSAIEAGNDSDESMQSRSKSFVSLLSSMTNSRGEYESYYEALGYDSLVPNRAFAALINPNGEIGVCDTIIKITPLGTYKFPKTYEKEFNKFLNENPDYEGTPIGENVNRINDKIILYKTFKENKEDYSTESDGEYELLPDDYFGNDDNDSISAMSISASEPDFDSFQTFNADRKTWAGKLIQKLIGSTKTSTIKFNKKRRIRGSFYFYNYGFYSEIGTKGWTDKKNWIGWSKTKADELRVGWKNVIIKRDAPDYFAKSIQSISNMVVFSPRYELINGQRINTATLIMPDFKANLLDKIISNGSKELFSAVKKHLENKSALDKVEAFIIASRTEIYYVTINDDRRLYNSAYYCHVFSNFWMENFVVSGTINSNGISFLFNNFNISNPSAAKLLSSIYKTLRDERPKLVSGEVYVCGRFGDVWRGMKIIKR